MADLVSPSMPTLPLNGDSYFCKMDPKIFKETSV